MDEFFFDSMMMTTKTTCDADNVDIGGGNTVLEAQFLLDETDLNSR